MHYEVQSCRHYGKCVSGYRPTRKSQGIVYGRSKKKSVIESISESTQSRYSAELLRYQKTVGTPGEDYLFYRQSYKGIPVSNGWLRIDESASDKKFLGVHTRILNDARIAEIESVGEFKPRVKETLAVSKAKTIMGPTRQWDVLDTKLCYRIENRTPRLAWKVQLAERMGVRSGEVYIDALRGTRIVVLKSTWSKPMAKGFVFRPNPLVRMDAATLPDPKQLPADSYIQVTIPVSQSSRVLRNDYAYAWSPDSDSHATAGQFFYDASDVRFGQTMALYYATWMQLYLSSTLGFSRANPGQVEFIVGFNREDNSYYELARNRVYLGLGGIPDFQDAEVILHEYSHAIHSVINQPMSLDKRPINFLEGFCDFMALSTCEHFKVKHGRLSQEFAAWDGWKPGRIVGDSVGIRRADDDDLLSDTENQIHSEDRSDRASEFWTGVLWDVRESLADSRSGHADSVVLGAFYKIDAPYTASHFARAMLLYNRSHYGGHKEKNLFEVFTRRGISVSL